MVGIERFMTVRQWNGTKHMQELQLEYSERGDRQQKAAKLKNITMGCTRHH